MFERYTESARRALFFARYEVSERGAIAIDTEHILLGLIREPRGVIGRILATSNVSRDALRRDIEARSVFREKVATWVEIPFTEQTTRALESAANEADRLGHGYIGTEHVLLGLLRVEGSVAEAILTARGLRLDDVRGLVVRLLSETPRGSDEPPMEESAKYMHVFELVRTTRGLVDQLAGLAHDRQRAEALTDSIGLRLDELERLLGG